MKRLNPNTNEVFTRGDIREDGFLFLQYNTQRIKKNGYFEESWLNKEPYLKERIRNTLYHARSRARLANIECSVTIDYLFLIFPLDFKCPILHTRMEWGGNKRTSPSLDRKVPELGYVEGNVCWISNKANSIKQDVTDPDDLIAVANYIKNIINGII